MAYEESRVAYKVLRESFSCAIFYIYLQLLKDALCICMSEVDHYRL